MHFLTLLTYLIQSSSYLPARGPFLTPHPPSPTLRHLLAPHLPSPTQRMLPGSHVPQRVQNTTNGHTFKYHRKLVGPDEYELDNSGRRKVPVKQAKEMENVKGHCDGICSALESSTKAQCEGSACKAQVRVAAMIWRRKLRIQWFNVPDLTA